MLHTRRRLLSLALAATASSLFSACSTTPPAAAPQKPKLLVLVVIDGLPMRQVTGYRDQLAPDGFARLLDHGRWFANAHYGHGHTVTAAGHSVMLSGAYPQRSGIISNEWRDPATGYLRRQVSPLSDLPVHLIEVEFPPGAEVAYPAAAFAFIRQAIWVIAGTLEFVEGAQLHRLRPGDCLELGPAADCAFRNPGRSPCRYLVAVVKR